MSDPKPIKMGYEGQAAQQQVKLGDCLWEAHSAGSRILEFTAGRTFADYAESEVLRAVVAKMLEIVGSALEEMQALYPEQAMRIEHLAEAVGLKQRLAGEVEDKVIWGFVETSLPPLVAEVAVLLDEWHQE